MECRMIRNHKCVKWMFLIAVSLSLFTAWILDVRQNVKAETTLSNPRIVTDSSMFSGQKVTWDCVWFGSYPQSEVTSEDSIYATLQNISDWNTSNDIVISGAKYHRMRKGDATYSMDDSDNYYQWTDSRTYHYFKYEPVKWRVLNINGNQALLLADQALDDQRYNESDNSVTWENCTIRNWLNNDFINKVFSSNEQSGVLTSNVENIDNLLYETEGENDTLDKIFLLSETEAYGTKSAAYGFKASSSVCDEARRCKSTDYTKAMGVYSSKSISYWETCWWWLRSPGDYAIYAANVDYDGWVNSGGDYVDSNDNGIRPALKLNISSSNLYSYAGTVCSDGTKNEVSGEKEENTSTTTASKPITTTASKPTTTTASKPSTTTVTTSIANKQGILTSLKSPQKGAIKIKWKKISGATNYKVYISPSKKFKFETITNEFKGSKSSITKKGLKSKKKYYVKIQPYAKKGSVVIYGKWSKVKSVKIK